MYRHFFSETVPTFLQDQNEQIIIKKTSTDDLISGNKNRKNHLLLTKNSLLLTYSKPSELTNFENSTQRKSSTTKPFEQPDKSIESKIIKLVGKKINEEDLAMISQPIQIYVPQLHSSVNYSLKEKNGLTPNRNVNGKNVDLFKEFQPQQKEKHQHDKKNLSSRRSLHTKSTSLSEAVDRKKRLTMPLIYQMYESQSDELSGTINGPDDDDFHPEEASKLLRQALSGGIQSNDQIIIDVLLSHNNFQRQKIAAAYEGMYNRCLLDDIEDETGGFFLETVLALLQPAHVYSARLLYHSILGRSCSRSIAVEIALTSTAPQLKVVRDAYQTEFRVTLERDLSAKVEGLFGKMIQQLLLRAKNFNTDIDVEMADREVKTLLNSAEIMSVIEKIGCNYDLFNRLFGTQGLKQICTFLERFDIHTLWDTEGNRRGRDFESLVRKSVNIHSDVRQMLLLFTRISRNMQLYFADKLHEAISGAQPDHASIIRILVLRNEIDLANICDEYKHKYGHNLIYDLQSTCSGDFLRLLHHLIHSFKYEVSAEKAKLTI